jgi:Fe-S-cluster containining protein
MKERTSLKVIADRGGAQPCDTCEAGCCRGFNLVIEGFDAYRIARDLKLPMIDFIDLRWTDKADGDHRLVLDGAAAERRWFRLMLLRVGYLHPQHAQRCIFLVSVGAQARCAVYASRPTMCRTYPSFLADGLLGTGGGRYCPPDAWHLESMNLPLLRRRQLFRSRHQAIYDYLCDAWTARVTGEREVRSAKDFCRYLMCTYTELELRNPEWFDELSEEQPVAREVKARLDEVLSELGWPISVEEPVVEAPPVAAPAAVAVPVAASAAVSAA